jgi:hypothetical protein
MWLNKNGYIYVGVDGHKVLQHRHVWRLANGDIPSGYEVHHVNHVRTDNRLENLELIEKAAHRRAHNPKVNKNCTMTGCTNKALAKLLCSKHYWRLRKYGDPATLTRGRLKLCSVSGCAHVAKSRGWCGKHYWRWMQHGDPTIRITVPKGTHCIYCPRPCVSRDMCHGHYSKWRRGTLDI